MTSLNRRSFLRTSALAAVGLTLSARSWAQVAGANGDVRVAVVGLNGRGKAHLKSFAGVPGVRVVALCDVDTAVLEKVAEGLRSQGQAVETFVDLRDLLARPDIDAVALATPNHVHALHAIWACQAGKDVYVEKPISHNVWEGRQLVAAAAKYRRVVQAGTQIRSNPGLIDAVEWVRSGQLGRVTLARGLCYKRRDSIGRTTGPQPVPATVNHDLWTGPAPLDPPRRRRYHYDWHWQWAFGNGDLGNQGIHQMDVARWFLGEPGLAPRTLSVGGRVGYEDDGETPNTLAVVHDYAKAPLVFEVRGLPEATGATKMGDYRGASVGNVIHCEGGHVVVPSYTTAKAFDKEGKLLKEFSGGGDHFANFIEAVRSRRTGDLRGPIEEGHISSALCHLANVSYELGAAQKPAVVRERIQGDAALAEAFGRMTEHLASNGVPTGQPLTLGVPLRVEVKAERCIGNPAADALLTRNYRKGFEVPALAAT